MYAAKARLKPGSGTGAKRREFFHAFFQDGFCGEVAFIRPAEKAREEETEWCASGYAKRDTE